MNKRKAKKARKKVIYPLVDEFNLIGMSEEERANEIDKYKRYCQKHYAYKHYKNAAKLIKKLHSSPIPAYVYPIPKAAQNLCSIFHSTNKGKIHIIRQDFSKLKCENSDFDCVPEGYRMRKIS